MSRETEETILEHVDPSRREVMSKMLKGAAFVIPVVSSFSLNGLTVVDAQANSNVTAS